MRNTTPLALGFFIMMALPSCSNNENQTTQKPTTTIDSTVVQAAEDLPKFEQEDIDSAKCIIDGFFARRRKKGHEGMKLLEKDVELAETELANIYATKRHTDTLSIHAQCDNMLHELKQWLQKDIDEGSTNMRNIARLDRKQVLRFCEYQMYRKIMAVDEEQAKYLEQEALAWNNFFGAFAEYYDKYASLMTYGGNACWDMYCGMHMEVEEKRLHRLYDLWDHMEEVRKGGIYFLCFNNPEKAKDDFLAVLDSTAIHVYTPENIDEDYKKGYERTYAEAMHQLPEVRRQMKRWLDVFQTRGQIQPHGRLLESHAIIMLYKLNETLK